MPVSTARLFSRIRYRLIIWYTGVLAAMLIVSGMIIFIAVQYALLTPVNDHLQIASTDLSHRWVDTGIAPCDERAPRDDVPFLACYNTDGALNSSNWLSSPIEPFTTPSLATQALAHNTAQDVVDAGNGLGDISRYATVVRDPQSGHAIGVIQVGMPVGGEIRAGQMILKILLGVGVIMLLIAVLAGLLLSSLALSPARLAFQRQQEFIADASHELRTPLTIFRSSTEVLLRGRDRLEPDDAQLVEDMLHEANHLTALSNQLLTLARLDGGVLQPQIDIVDLRVIAERTLRRAQMLARERDITITLEGEQPAMALGDAELLAEVALILVDNAIKYNQSGGSVVLSTGYQGVNAYIAVRDNGQGILPEQIARLGERFYRVDKARSREMGGSGLGLAIARRLLSIMSGSLQIESKQGSGTTVTVVVPTAAAHQEQAKDRS
jgi:signal transduction histidine kinase